MRARRTRRRACGAGKRPGLAWREGLHRACNSCHIGGAAGLGPALNNKPLPGWLIRFQVRNGLGVMPEFSEDQVSEAELDALLVYLDTLKHREWPAAALSTRPE